MRIKSSRVTTTNTNESGNILIYILGAIALLGLLIIAVKGSSTPGSNINDEELILRVSEVQQYGRELEQAVAYILQNGFSETDLRFAHPDAASAYGVITDNPQRQIFAREGGGATYRAPPNDIQTSETDWVFSSKNQTWWVGTTCGAPSCADVIAILQNVSENFCLLMNEKNNIESAAGAPPQDVGIIDATTPFDGVYNVLGTIKDVDDYLSGNNEGCFEGGGTPPAGTYHYYRVLLAR